MQLTTQSNHKMDKSQDYKQKSYIRCLSISILICLLFLEQFNHCLIITSVIAGDKKFKTVSFDSKFIKPLTFEKDLPFSTQFRRHQTMRMPKFDVDINVPIKLPMEDEYYHEEPRKPVESNFFFETGDIKEKSAYKANYNNAPGQHQQYQASNIKNRYHQAPRPTEPISYADSNLNLHSVPQQYNRNIKTNSHSNNNNNSHDQSIKMANGMIQPNQQQANMIMSRSDTNIPSASYPTNPAYQKPQQQHYDSAKYPQQQEFIPGGYINLQLSGPSGGPKMTHEDYDRDNWSRQMSNTEHAMPFPILNYQQLQNFYGGLGTFTNGLPETRYVETSIMDKIISTMSDFGMKRSNLKG